MPGLFSRAPESGHSRHVRGQALWPCSPTSLRSVWEMMILQRNSWDAEAAGREGKDKRGPQEGRKRDRAREAY